MFGIGMTELMVIFVIGLIVLGPKRLPELARSLGRSLAEFRRTSSDLRQEFMDVAEEARIDPVRVDEPGSPRKDPPGADEDPPQAGQDEDPQDAPSPGPSRTGDG